MKRDLHHRFRYFFEDAPCHSATASRSFLAMHRHENRVSGLVGREVTTEICSQRTISSLLSFFYYLVTKVIHYLQTTITSRNYLYKSIRQMYEIQNL